MQTMLSQPLLSCVHASALQQGWKCYYPLIKSTFGSQLQTDTHTFCKFVEDCAPLPGVFLVGGHQGVKLKQKGIGR